MAENPYTLHVSTTQITFTNAFKEEFWRRYQEGDTPRTIMYDLGYDPEVLGRNRLSGIQNVVCKQAVSAKGFHERPQRRCARQPGFPGLATMRGWALLRLGRHGKHRIALILSWFWRHTTGGNIPKGHGTSIEYQKRYFGIPVCFQLQKITFTRNSLLAQSERFSTFWESLL